MKKHPEGGYYVETFRDRVEFDSQEHDGIRNISTMIYYLITPEEFSGLHLVKSNESFHFYQGDSCRMLQISENGEHQEILIGDDLESGARPQVMVSKNTWQATKLIDGGEFALFGCCVAPGFHFDDFINCSYDSLTKLFPEKVELLKEFTNH